ncbi:chaplin [Streptomyces sp. NPDC047028]|uniref:chaplin n=1 Tax=Streptomyces sp. NPDC047028 TaxID=3155793 RepID=UPI003407EC38
MAVASGAMAVAGPAHADSAADGSANGSPGVLSGNNVQVPLDVPVNVCGNTVDVVGLLNPAMGNSCANRGGDSGGDKSSSASGQHGPSRDRHHGSSASGHHGSPTSRDGGSSTSGGASASGVTEDSPGILSGNGLELPIHLPVNLSGNSVNAVGVGNPVFGNESVNGPADQPTKSRAHHTTKVHRTTVVRERTGPMLAHTGADNPWVPAAASLASLTAGAVLYRRFRPRIAHREA